MIWSVAIAGVGFGLPFATCAADMPTKYILAEANSRIPIEVAWDVNLASCQPVSTGAFTPSSGVFHGKLDYEHASVPLPPGNPCSGIAVPATIAYYRWTAGPSADIETFTLRYVADRDGQTRTYPIVIAAPVKHVSDACDALIDKRVAISVEKTGVGTGIQSLALRGRIAGSFTPSGGVTLMAAASTCGFDGFAWTQLIVSARTRMFGVPPFYDGASNTKTGSPLAQPPFYYGVGLDWASFPSYRFTLDNYSRISARYCPRGDSWHADRVGSNTLCFADYPTFTQDETFIFITSLVGFNKSPEGPYMASEPLAKWIWRDDINGRKNGFRQEGLGVENHAGCIMILQMSPNVVQSPGEGTC